MAHVKRESEFCGHHGRPRMREKFGAAPPSVEDEVAAIARLLEKNAALVRYAIERPPEGSVLAERGIYRSCGLAAAEGQVRETLRRLAALYRRVSKEEGIW